MAFNITSYGLGIKIVNPASGYEGATNQPVSVSAYTISSVQYFSIASSNFSLSFQQSELGTINGVAAGGTVDAITQQLLNAGGPNSETTLATLTAQGAQTNTATPDQVNPAARGLMLAIDITAITGTTPTLTVTIQGKDPASGKYYTLLASAALNATGTTILTIYPGLVAAANTVAVNIMPKTWRVIYTIGGTTPSVTATIGAVNIV
jgi:hypothetical protein